MLAIIDAYRHGLLRIPHWWPNLLAGIVVGIIAIPLAMAFAIASGVRPEQGLYTAIVASFIVGIFGGSRTQIAGPTGAFIVILANITAHYGIDGLQIATLLAGFLLVIMGGLKLGNVIKFIPDSVIIGFTAGIGCIIFIGEWKDFFGLSVQLPLDGSFQQKLALLLPALFNPQWSTLVLACLSLLLLLLSPKIIKRVPGALIAIFIVTLIQYFCSFTGVATLGSAFGGIPQQLPSFHVPLFTLNQASELMLPAFTIALLGAIESLLSATTADRLAGTKHHANQELIGQGLANILTPFFGGFAATGAIARTATNIRHGGNSPIAAVVHAVVLVLVIVLFAPLAKHIPLCTLAAVLFVVAYNMSDLPHLIQTIKTAPTPDVLVLLTTFFLTVFTNLVLAVNIGVFLAFLLKLLFGRDRIAAK